MHCVACETLLEDNLGKIPGVSKVSVSHKSGTAVITQENAEKPDAKIIADTVRQSGYQLAEGTSAGTSGNTWTKLVWLLMVPPLFYVITKIDLSRFFPDTGDGISVLAAIGVGVVASFSTCLALTGGLIIGLSAKLKQADGNASIKDLGLLQLRFQAGRLLSFFFLGGLLGLLGQGIAYSLHAISFLSGLVALVMLYLGLNILGLLPDISRLGLHLPKRFGTGIGSLRDRAPFLLGALTFFLPCGFTQSMQLLAVASGNFLQAGLIMLLFALGTMPVLFSVGLGASISQRPGFGIAKKMIGALIIVFALYSLQSALLVAGFRLPWLLYSQTQDAQVPTETSGDVQIVRMDLDYYFMQEEFRIKKDIPVRWEINAINISGCSNEVIIPRLGISSGKLKKGLNVVEFTPTESGVLPFSCWMGMLSGRFIVE